LTILVKIVHGRIIFKNKYIIFVVPIKINIGMHQNIVEVEIIISRKMCNLVNDFVVYYKYKQEMLSKISQINTCLLIVCVYCVFFIIIIIIIMVIIIAVTVV